MQKIMFEHRRFGLEQAVIARLKEMTRRRVRFPKGIDGEDVENPVMGIDKKGRVYFTFTVSTHWGAEAVDAYPKYQIGEQVAVAQSYESINEHLNIMARCMINPWGSPREHHGWTNKMYVAPGLMPHVIEITDIKAERLQDISDDEIVKEGCFEKDGKYFIPNVEKGFSTAREAFSTLIDSVSKHGLWESNPYVFAYKFKLLK